MYKFLILLLLTSLYNYAKGQETDDIKNVISTVTSSISPNFNVCTDNADLPAYLVKQVNIYLEKDTLLHLSAEEKKELQNKLSAAQHASKWQGSTINGIPVISSDTVKKVMGDSANVWEYFKKKYPKPFSYSLHTFSRPVFIRNNTICLFFFDQSSYGGTDPNISDSLSGGLYIYIKNGNNWVKKVTVFHYIT